MNLFDITTPDDGLIYLGSPYSHPEPRVRQRRFELVCAVAAAMMRVGHLVFSPIAHTHPIAEAGDLPKGWDFWKRYDEVMLAASARLVVLKLPGWEESKGIAGEIEIMTAAGKPVLFLEVA